MANPYSGYIDLEYTPDKNEDVIVLWYAESEKFNVNTFVNAIASESSIGTWTDIKTLKEEVREKLRARVFEIIKINEHKAFFKIAYPYDLFETSNLDEILSSIVGNVFGLKELTFAKVLDIYFPKKIQKFYKGPIKGLEGIRKLVGTEIDRRPHLGTIVKPKIGLNAEEWAKVAYESALGGVDFIKDDENLTSQNFCRFEDRVIKTLELIDKAQDETGRKILYSPNITHQDLDEMVKRAEFVKEHGGKIVMIDVVIVGFSGLYTIRKILEELNLAIHAHRAMHAAFDRGNFGIDYKALAKIFRLIGVDQLHAGTIVGKMEGELQILDYYKVLRENKIEENKFLFTLEQEFIDKIKPVMPVASGGLHLGLIEALVEILGKDLVIQMGGGIHGFPKGSYYGAKATREALLGILEGKSYRDLARENENIKIAIEKWGYLDKEYVKEFWEVYNFFKGKEDILLREFGIKYLYFINGIIRELQKKYTFKL